MKMRISLFLSILLLAGCQFISGVNKSSNVSDSQWKSQHVRIDDAVIDQGDPWNTMDPVYWTVNIYEGEKEYNDTLSPFSHEQRLVLAVNWYIAEVNNGGHDQFYYNSTGIVRKDAFEGFLAMGLAQAAGILEESTERMGGEPSLDREARWEQMDEHSPDFEDLDSAFYDLENESNLDAAIQEYIEQHREAFYFDGDVLKP